MTKILIPRSDSISAKIIEPSDFEKVFSDDVVTDYKKSGFTIAAGSGLAISVSSGVIRLKGLYLESSASETVSSLTASDVNYIYVKLARDSASEAESWDFFKNLTGTTPTDAFFIGTATTNGSAVTSVDQTDVEYRNVPKLEWIYFGDGADGDVTISSNTSISESKRYNNLTIDASRTLTSTTTSEATIIIKVRNNLIINGAINTDGKGGSAGAGVAGGNGGSYGVATAGSGGSGGIPLQVGDLGQTGGLGVLGQIGNNDTHRLESGVGGSGAGGTGGDMPAGWAGVIRFDDDHHDGYYNNVSGGSGDLTKAYKLGRPADLHLTTQPGLSNVANIRFNIPFYIATQLPQLFGGGGSGGTSGHGGQGGAPGIGNGGNGGAGGASGAGGKGGGGIIICAKSITIASGGTISANGVNGVNGTDGSDGVNGPNEHSHGGGGGAGGGGGGGGEAGQIILLYKTLTNSGTITATGGTGGTAGSGGDGGSGQGSSGADGGNGGAGGNGSNKTLVSTSI